MWPRVHGNLGLRENDSSPNQDTVPLRASRQAGRMHPTLLWRDLIHFSVLLWHCGSQSGLLGITRFILLVSGRKLAFFKNFFFLGFCTTCLLFPLVKPHQLVNLLTCRVKGPFVSLKNPLEFQAPRPSTFGLSKWSVWLGYKWFSCRPPLSYFFWSKLSSTASSDQ